MVRTRKQADAEAQAADPRVPAPIINAASSRPPSAQPKEGGAKKTGSKEMTPKKASPRKPCAGSQSTEDKVNSRSTPSSKKDKITNEDAAREKQIVKEPRMLATKKKPMKRTTEGIVQAPSNRKEKEEVDRAELAKEKGKARSKATRTKRATESDTAENKDALATGESPKKKTTAKKLKKLLPRNAPTDRGSDPDKTETEEDLEQSMEVYEKRKHKQAATKRKAPIIDAGKGQQSAEPPRKKSKRSTASNTATKDDGARDGPVEGMTSGGSPKGTATATKKAAKGPKPQAEPAIGMRRSERISSNLIVSSGEDEGYLGRKPLQTRFRKRMRTPEVSDNKIGLDDNESFNPRFPIDTPKPTKATRRTLNGDNVSTKGEKE